MTYADKKKFFKCKLFTEVIVPIFANHSFSDIGYMPQRTTYLVGNKVETFIHSIATMFVSILINNNNWCLNIVMKCTLIQDLVHETTDCWLFMCSWCLLLWSVDHFTYSYAVISPHVNHHYPGTICTVVFDGYENTANSTKYQEQIRHYRLRRSANINLIWDTPIPTKLLEKGIHTLKAIDDADILIVKTAVEQSTHDSVAVVIEDVDLAVLLIASTPPTRDIIMLKPGRGEAKTMALSIQEMQNRGVEYILFLHSFTGCDTTSATFRRSKVGFLKLYLESEIIKQAAMTFYNPSSTYDQVEKAGKM
ncbi:hypothetical protein QTP88_008799 [Uroleucon formosanum]